MEKYAVDLDKVLDEFEFNEDRAEQYANILAKRNSSIAPIPPVVGLQNHVLHQSTSAYRRPTFEPINLADADFAADLKISAPCYSSTYSSAANSSAGQPQNEGNNFVIHSEHMEDNDIDLDCHNSESEWHNNVTSTFYNHGRVGINEVGPNLEGVNDRMESSTNKINVSGVFTSLNEYINAGNIEAKLTDANTSCQKVEPDQVDNFASRNSTLLVGGKMLNHQSSIIYPKTVSGEHVENERLVDSVNIHNVWTNNNEGVRLISGKWTDTVDVCKVSENNSKTSFADLIPTAYSNSLQEDIRDVAKASSDETPDLLDRTVIANKTGKYDNFEIEDTIHANETIVAERNTILDISSQQSLLPDVASSGRSAFKANMRSDLIASHDAVKRSDDENIDQSISHDIEVSDSQTFLANEGDYVEAELKHHESCSSQHEDEPLIKVAPVGFNALEELSDAELHQYLEELEDNEVDSETMEENGNEPLLESLKYPADFKELNEKERVSIVKSVDDKSEGLNISTKIPAEERSESLTVPTKIVTEESEEDSDIHDFINRNSTENSNHQVISTFENSQDCTFANINEETNLSSTENVSESIFDCNSAPETRADETQTVSCNEESENISNAEISSIPETSNTGSLVNNIPSIVYHHIDETVDESNDSTDIKTVESTSAEFLETVDSPTETIDNSTLQQDSVKYLENTSDASVCDRTLPISENIDSEVMDLDTKDEDNDENIEQISTLSTEIEYSEVPSCLVRMPKDGSTINVLGEEERPSRPKYLFLPSKITVENEQEESENSEVLPAISTALGAPGETPPADVNMNRIESSDEAPVSSPDVSESSVDQAIALMSSMQIVTPESEELTDTLTPEERTLGKRPPYWVPDAHAPSCMQCQTKFTVLKRRHHCRACGKVLCYRCCSLKTRLEYMENTEARVCQPCYTILVKVSMIEQGVSASGSPSSLNENMTNGSSASSRKQLNANNTRQQNQSNLIRQPNPNNPMEYCSTIPPLEQAASVLRQPPPSVLVPVGVLKREGSSKNKSDVAKKVIFSDGIRPGGDLTELDGSSEPRLPYRRPGRVLKRVGTPPGPPSASSQRHLPILEPNTMSYIPADKGLPPLAIINKGDVKFEDVVDNEKLIATLKSETEQPPLFAINRNLFVAVKIINLDCCVNRVCWCFTTKGMCCVGQDEIVIILECLPNEIVIPKDIFNHLNTLYREASRGNTVAEMGHTVFQGVPFLDSLDNGGFIYVRPSFQCLRKLILPPSPYLVALLVHRYETPWATVLPIRLMLRLGAEYRYYPSTLVSMRNRKPVFWEIGHTIINLLADFRNLSYTLPSICGMYIHMEDKQTSILLPRNRYDQVTRTLNNSNDHVLALASNFSLQADSHLVCIQSENDDTYHTQAINILTRPRKITGASFVVFNGALKTSSNLTAKSSIVEDGLMVQITSDTMQALRAALRNMQDFCIGCGAIGATEPDETVTLKWVQEDKSFNMGVKSSIDGRPLDGVPSIRIHNGTDYMGTCRFIRWTEVFIIKSDEGSGRRGDPLDISRLSESLARATCMALIKLLDLLAQAELTQISVRATVHPENVGYEAGSRGEKLPPIYMDSLDNELVPVLHKAAQMSQDNASAILELIFHIMLQ